MEFMDCLCGRRSVREFKDKKVERKVIERVVYGASFAPSWKNTQTARYIVVENEGLMDDIATNCMMGFEFNRRTIKNAPVLVVLTTVSGRSGFERDGSFTTSKGDRWEMFDAGIAAQCFCLAAYNEGLGTVIMGIFDEEALARSVAVPEGQSVSAIIAIGYPAQQPVMPKRKNVEELISYR